MPPPHTNGTIVLATSILTGSGRYPDCVVVRPVEPVGDVGGDLLPTLATAERVLEGGCERIARRIRKQEASLDVDEAEGRQQLGDAAHLIGPDVGQVDEEARQCRE